MKKTVGIRILPLFRILGIDPGSRITGFGIVEFSSGNLVPIECGNLTISNGSMGQRLYDLATGLEEIIERTAPVEVAVERVFVGINAESALKLGQARGVALLTAAKYKLPISEYSPNQIKKAVVGRGHADKNQMKFMVKTLLNLPEMPMTDAADALAVAVCHCHTRRINSLVSGVSTK